MPIKLSLVIRQEQSDCGREEENDGEQGGGDRFVDDIYDVHIMKFDSSIGESLW